jgi:hypothetical protein
MHSTEGSRDPAPVAGPQGDTLGRGSRFGEMMCRSARHRAASAREQHQQEARQQTAIAKLKSGNHPTEVAEFDAGTFERHRQLLLHLRRKTHGQSPDQ